MKNLDCYYYVENLESALYYILDYDDLSHLILSNTDSAIRCYGAVVVDRMLKTLQKDFPKMKSIKINVANSFAGFFTAIKLGYNFEDIIYTGKSNYIKNMLSMP